MANKIHMRDLGKRIELYSPEYRHYSTRLKRYTDVLATVEWDSLNGPSGVRVDGSVFWHQTDQLMEAISIMTGRVKNVNMIRDGYVDECEWVEEVNGVPVTFRAWYVLKRRRLMIVGSEASLFGGRVLGWDDLPVWFPSFRVTKTRQLTEKEKGEQLERRYPTRRYDNGGGADWDTEMGHVPEMEH